MADDITKHPRKTNAMVNSAVAYARFKWRVIPLEPQGKKPITRNGLNDATTDDETVRRWWAQTPDANIGIATGAGLLVLDIDGEKGEATLKALTEQYGPLPPTPCQRTGKGRHFLFRVEGETRNTAGRIGWRGEYDDDGKKVSSGIDTRGDGGYIVICPSVHPTGAKYAWDGDMRPSKVDPAPAPEWLLIEMSRESERQYERKISEQAAPVASLPDGGHDKYVQTAIDREVATAASAGKGQRNHALNLAAYNLGTLVGAGQVQEATVKALLMSAAAQSGLAQEDGKAACEKTIDSGMRAGIAKPRVMPERVGAARRAQASGGARTLRLAASDGASVSSTEVRVTTPSVWVNNDAPEHDEFVLTNEGGKAKGSLHNVMIHMRREIALNGLFVLDEMSRHILISRAPVWAPDDDKAFPRLLCDADITSLVCLLETRGLSPKFADAKRVIQLAAQENIVNPIRDRLAALQWDGTERLDFWMADYLSAADSSFSRQAGAKWLISAVARVMKPGCKVDTMLVLEGPQGARKSSALAALAGALGDHCFTDRLSKLDAKDAAIELQGNVIVEIAELDAFKGAQVSTIKAFLSRMVDKIRLPWDATITEMRRSCVFAGTVNPGGCGWLHDATGARRFWPVEVGAIDLAGLAEIAPQLWAEALSRYKDGERWWLEDAVVIAEQEAAAAARYEEDAWAPYIDTYIATRRFVQVSDILEECIKVEKSRIDIAMQRRVGAHMRRRGWDYKPVRENNVLRKMFVRPADDPKPED